MQEYNTWGNILQDFTNREQTTPPLSFSYLEETLKTSGKSLRCSTMRRIRTFCTTPRTQVRIVRTKIIHNYSDLTIKATQVYDHIINACPNDSAILRIHNLINKGPYHPHHKVSGRSIDMLITRYTKFVDIFYYLDPTPTGFRIVSEHQRTDRTILFNVKSSYNMKLQQYSKTYFDCFNRGTLVWHKLSDGSPIRISLCQFMFYIWASRFCVFDFFETKLVFINDIRRCTSVKKQKKTKGNRDKRGANQRDTCLERNKKKTYACSAYTPGVFEKKKRVKILQSRQNKVLYQENPHVQESDYRVQTNPLKCYFYNT